MHLGYVQSLLEGAAAKSADAEAARNRVADDTLVADDTPPFVAGAYFSALDESVESKSAGPVGTAGGVAISTDPSLRLRGSGVQGVAQSAIPASAGFAPH